MEILGQDFKKGFVKLKVDDLDDLWYLSHLIDAGDSVRSQTTRKIKLGNEQDKSKVAKKTMVLKIEAETIDLDENGKSLRINGKVLEGPEDVPHGSYHALSLEEGSEFTLEKAQWGEYQKRKLQEAAEKKYSYIICLFDREEALFALTKKFGYDVILELKGEVPKKNKSIEIKKDFYEEIIKTLETYEARYHPEKIILASTAFYKEDLFKKIASPELRRKIVLAGCTDVSAHAITEVIRSPELKEVLKSSRAREEEKLIEELLSEINKDNLAVYGMEEVKRSVSAGAVKDLLLTDKKIKESKEKKEYHLLDEMMKSIDRQQGKVHILSSRNEAGKNLDGLGGIAAILRYKMR